MPDTIEASSALIPLPSPSRALTLARLEDLATEAADLARKSRSESTRSMYEQSFADFRSWCVEHDQPALPTRPEVVALYLTDRRATLHPTTLQFRIVAIRAIHKMHRHHLDTGHPAITDVMEGIRRVRRAAGLPAVTKKTALRRHQLDAVLSALPSPADLPEIASRARRRAVEMTRLRDRAVILAGFVGAFRRSELVALDVPDLAAVPEGFAVMIRHSKTDQIGEGQSIALKYGQHVETCPVRALRAWLEAAGITEGPVFRAIDKAGNVLSDRTWNTTRRRGTISCRLSPAAVAIIVKRAIARVGLKPADFAGHSLRSGFATSAADAGATLDDIMRQTRHKDRRVAAGYVQRGTLFRNPALDALGM